MWKKEKGPFLFSPSPPSPHYCWLLFPLLKFRKWELVVGFSPQLRVFPVLLLWVLGLDTVFLVVLLLSVWQSKQIMGASLLILRRWELVVGFALHPSLFALCFSVFFLDYCPLPIHFGFPSWSLSKNTSRIKPFLFEFVVGHKEWKFTLLFKILIAGDVLIRLNRLYGTSKYFKEIWRRNWL